MLIMLFIYYLVVPKAHLSITSDSPAIIGANITFNALLSGYSRKSFLTYIFYDGVKTVSFKSENCNVSISLSFPQELYAEGNHYMNVTVLIIKEEIAFNYTNFDLRSM